MKGSKDFKNTIKRYLDDYASKNELFAVKYKDKVKKLDDCITYILNTVKDSGASGMTDDEVYGMALHYYDEDTIDIGKEIKAQVVVNHHVELTDDDRNEIRTKAIEKEIEKAREVLSKPKTVSKPKEDSAQSSLF